MVSPGIEYVHEGVELVTRVRNRWIGLISAAAAILVVYGIYLIQLRQIELQHTVPVLVPVSFVPAGTLLTEEMLEWKPMMKGSVSETMATELESVVRMENIVPLGRQEPILLWKLDKFRLLPSAEQATFHIPREYVLTVSSGIRAGDEVELFLSGKEGGSRKLFDYPVKVASVKSSAGGEIDDERQSNLLSSVSGDKERMYASRRASGGVIDHINLNLTEEEWLTIDQLCKDGKHKLVVAFTPNSILEKEENHAHLADQR